MKIYFRGASQSTNIFSSMVSTEIFFSQTAMQFNINSYEENGTGLQGNTTKGSIKLYPR